MNVVDSLVIELGLDPAKFNKGQKDALDAFKKTQDQAKRVGKEIENSSAQVLEFFSRLKTQAISLGATFLGAVGVKDFIENITGAGIALDRTARFTGESVRELSAWRNVSEQAGGSADATTASMLSLTQSLQNFALTGESNVIPYFRALGISLTDSQGHIKTASQLLLDLAGSDRLKHLDPRRAAVILQSLGLDPATTNLILTNSRVQLAAKLKLAQKNAFTDKDTALAKQFTQQFKEISQEAVRVGQNIFIVMAPALKEALGLIKEFVDFLRSNQYVATGFFLALSGVISGSLIKGALTPLLFNFRLLSGFLTGQLFLQLALLTDTLLPALATAFLAVGAAIEATPLGWILTGLAAIIGVSYLAYKALTAKPSSGAGSVANLGGPPPGAPTASPLDAGGGDIVSFGVSRPSTGLNSAATAAAWQAAVASEKKYGVPAAVTFAQWRLESANGTRVPYGSNNPFGIKALPGQPSVTAPTTEYANGQRVSTTANFAKFASVADAFDAHARLLANSPRYAAARNYKNNPAAYANALTGVYATDPDYGNKLNALIAGGQSSINNQRSTTVHIDTIEVHNPKDATQVAANVRTELSRNIFAGNANNGAQ